VAASAGAAVLSIFAGDKGALVRRPQWTTKLVIYDRALWSSRLFNGD